MIYAARLAATASADRQVILLTRRADARDALASGLTVERPGRAPEVQVVDARIAEDIPSGSQQVLLLTIKTFHNRVALPGLARLMSPGGTCLSIQNGIQNLNLMREILGPDMAFQGATGAGGTALGPARVMETGTYATWIPAAMPHVSWLGAWLELAGLNPVLVDGVDRIQWHKAAVGGMSGGVAVLLDMPFGQAIRKPGVRDILREVLHEIVAVATACGVTLDLAEEESEQDRMFDSVSPEAMTSTYSDYCANRPTELTDRFEPILEIAGRHGIGAPVLRSLFLLTREKLAASLEASPFPLRT